MNQHKLSIVILTHNEVDNIERCLKSIERCDDIILIDNSTDKTLEIAKKIIPAKNLHIYQNDITDDFSSLRNLGLGYAKHDWVLFLDADEEVSSNLYQEILDKIVDDQNQGYYLQRQDYFLGKWLKYGETGQIKLLKLGQKNAGSWQRQVHEVWNIQGNIGKLNHPLKHYPHPTVAEFIERINRWTTLDAKVFHEQGVKSNFWKIIIYPFGKFFINYFWKLGFLDGTQGFIFATLMSFHSFLTRAKLYLL